MNRWVLLGALGLVGLLVAYSTTSTYQRASLWGDDWRGKPLVERARILPAEIAKSLHGESFGIGLVASAVPAENAEYILDDLRAAIESIPESVQRLVERRLIGVYLVQGMKLKGGLNAAGLAFPTKDFFRQYSGTVIFIDAESADSNPNQALAGLSFVPLDRYGYFSLEPELAGSGSNDRVTTLRTVLLHELGHLIDRDREITPESFNYGAVAEPGCGFTCLSWERRWRQRNGDQLRKAFGNLRHGAIKEYVFDLPKTLQALKRSNFPSLYGAMLPEEDFADSFAMYVHTVMLGLPWEITFRVNGEIKAEIGSCYTEGRCPRKREFFDALLAEAGS